jgi:hypothetical protein
MSAELLLRISIKSLILTLILIIEFQIIFKTIKRFKPLHFKNG